MLMHFAFFIKNKTFLFTIIFITSDGTGTLCISITNTCKHVHNTNATLNIAYNRCRRMCLSVSAIFEDILSKYSQCGRSVSFLSHLI
uniref:Putative secreted protein n=1 Tax=Xenopsylla cheopis TaxID=163159 RepID=A0A6M2DZV8_XENCH